MQVAQMQCLLGLQCNGFAMIAADQTRTMSILIMKNDADKIFQLSDRLLMGVIGEAGDTEQFTQFVTRNIKLYQIRNGYSLDTNAAVNFTRKSLADSLRNRAPYILDLLMAGYDEKEGAQLFYMDFVSACLKLPFAGQGFGGLIATSIMAQYYKPTLTEEEAYDIMKLCVKEIHLRLVLNLPNFLVKVVSKDGITTLPVISEASFNGY